MLIGVCTGNNPENIKKVKNAGFDYAELNCKAIAASTQEELDTLKEIGLPFLAANCFIDLAVVGEERDDAALREYIDTMMKKGNYLGVKTMVYGSSGSREVPSNMTKKEAWVQVASFLRDIVAPACEKYDITVAIEPLRERECNCINTVKEGIEIAKMVNHPRITVLADVFHMYEQGDSLEAIASYPLMSHAHTSNPDGRPEREGRYYPKKSDKFNQDLFILPCIEAGIEKCSIEANVIDLEKDLADAFEVLKKYRNA